MRSSLILFFLALPWIGSGIAEEEALAAASTVDAIYASAHEAFQDQDQDLLQAIPEDSLQAALRDLKDFKTGVFESHSRGVEHVRDIHNNPALATRLLVAAVRDLHKRQAPANGTTAGQPQNTPQQSSVASTQVSVQSTPQQSTQQTTQAQPSASGSEAPLAPTTTARPITTDGSTLVQTTQIQIPSQPTASIAITLTTTNPQGSTFLTTYTPPPSPPAGKISSVVLLRTTTDADGQPSTITSYTLVDPAEEATGSTQAQNPAQATATQAGAGKPGLQTAAASRRRHGGVVGVMMGWFGCVGGVVGLLVLGCGL